MFRRKTKSGNEEKPLMKNIQQTEGEQASGYSSQQSGVPDLIARNVEVRLLNTLRKILSDQSTPEDFDSAVEVSKTWRKLHNSYSQDWLCKYLQEIDQFVERRFPTLPAEGPRGSQVEQIQDFLKSAQSMIRNDVSRLTPVLKDAGLLVHLIDSYSRHLFTNLDLLLNRDLSVQEIFCLLLWGKDVFFSPDSQHFFRVDDPLLLTGWIERAKRKLLPKLQNKISTILQNILCYDEKQGHNEDSMDEETFIRVYLDVTQCLNAVIQSSKKFSHTLMCTTQMLCLKELHHFVQGFFAPRLNSPATNNSDGLSNIILMLEELEDHALSIVQKMMKHLAQTFLRRYFKGEDEQIQMLTEAIQKQFASLPQTDVGKEIQEIFVNVTYDCVSHMYLDCLVKSKFRQLEKRWGNVGERMREDALSLHNTLIEMSGSDDQKNHLLQRMSEVLLCSDVDALKITCCHLFRDFPQDSEQYVPDLLCWKRVLSKRQVREVLDVSRDLGLNPKPSCFPCQPLKGLCCFM
ncbi:exocyst complex component 3-like protein [Labeo rohita]|uniref:Exocyst complex component 3-like protein n=1 Tax=Labeo rohita TaxID=84645 RepID=A0A498MZ27_LABRO|nr:exocyst complex component 3-like protein [Labeo rohita]